MSVAPLENLIYGTLLGDGCIARQKSPFLSVGHCAEQLPYLKWKADKLGVTKFYPRTSGFGSQMYAFTYYNKPLLTEVYDICRGQDGKKRVTERWIAKLDNLSLAVWYQDDGSWASCGMKKEGVGRYLQRYVRFSTCGFDKHSNELLMEWLQYFGIYSRLKTYSGYDYILLGHDSTRRLWDIVAPYIVLPHKLDLEMKPGINWCKCGYAMDNQSHKECNSCLYQDAIRFDTIGEHPEYKSIYQKLIKRFGTCSLSKLKANKPNLEPLNEYWVDLSSVGTKL